MSVNTLPIHIAVTYFGCAAETPKGVAMRSVVGPHIECLAEYVDRVTVLAYDPPERQPAYEDMVEFVAQPKRDNIRVVSLGPKGTWRDQKTRSARVAAVVHEASMHWDVLLFRMPNRRSMEFFRANQCPRIVTMAGGYVPGVARSTPGPLLRKAISIAAAYRSEMHFRRIARASGLLFANSESLMRRYHGSFPDLMLQRSSVRRQRFSYQADDRMAGPVVKMFFAGNLTRAKGVFELLSAFVRLKRDVLPHAELHLAGSGDAESELKAEALRQGVKDSVIFHGWVAGGEPIFDLYRQMDVFVFPSYYEGFPKVVWEAMAHSLPVVCTPVGGLRDAFTHEKDLLFVPIRNVEALVDAVTLLKNTGTLRRRLIANAFERANESTLEYVVEDLLRHIAARWPLGKPAGMTPPQVDRR